MPEAIDIAAPVPLRSEEAPDMMPAKAIKSTLPIKNAIPSMIVSMTIIVSPINL